MTMTSTRPSRNWLFMSVLSILALVWMGAVKLFLMVGYLSLEDISMIKRLLLLTLPPLLLAAGLYLGYSAWDRKDVQQVDPSAVQSAVAHDEAAAAAAQRDPRFTLEIRRFGVTVDKFRQRAILMRLEEAGANAALLSPDPKEYPYTGADRGFAEGQRENNVFGYTLRQWTDYWPIPVIVAGPPRNPANPLAGRMATHIGTADNGAGIGNTLYIRLDEIHTEHGDDVVNRLFEFFDKHPDLPAAVVLVEDGLNTRTYMRTPGDNYLQQRNVTGYFVPKRPDSFVALLVTRKDRVDRMIRPYVVEAPEAIDKTKTQYDVIKLWNYFWDTQEAYWNQQETVDMPWDVWQGKLPEFWKTTPLKIPAGFKPNPWVPIPWTTWQLKEYDDWAVLAYLHRPERADLSNGHGEPLKKGEKIGKLQAAWRQSLDTLAPGEQPGRILYDTGESTQNLPLLIQALHDNPQHIDLDDPKDAFDMQRRIGGDTGTSSTWVQMALALMMGYGDGKTSALINLRDPLHATIVMVTPPDLVSREANPQTFSWHF